MQISKLQSTRDQSFSFQSKLNGRGGLPGHQRHEEGGLSDKKTTSLKKISESI